MTVTAQPDSGQKALTDRIIGQAANRKNVLRLVPDGSRNILDLGCGTGSLLLRLKRDKNCTGLYAIETAGHLTQDLNGLVDGVWNINIEQSGQDIPAEFTGKFNFIIMHDVVEHLFDPWYTLPKLRPYLARDGRLIIATPNLQHWEFLHTILSGDFPYGPGLWHTGHLRWFTLRSLLELATLSGFSIEKIFLEIPYDISPQALTPQAPFKELELPPRELQAAFPDRPVLRLSFPRDIGPSYPVFLAHKLIFVCTPRPSVVVTPRPMTYNCPLLAELRRGLDNPFDVYTPPPFTPLVGDWC